MVGALGMICSCQRQNPAAEQQVIQRSRQLDAREAALDGQEKVLDERERALAERERALGGRERALAEREKAIANVLTITPEVQGQTSDPAQVEADRDSSIEQLPAEVRAL